MKLKLLSENIQAKINVMIFQRNKDREFITKSDWQYQNVKEGLWVIGKHHKVESVHTMGWRRVNGKHGNWKVFSHFKVFRKDNLLYKAK